MFSIACPGIVADSCSLAYNLYREGGVPLSDRAASCSSGTYLAYFTSFGLVVHTQGKAKGTITVSRSLRRVVLRNMYNGISQL